MNLRKKIKIGVKQALKKLNTSLYRGSNLSLYGNILEYINSPTINISNMYNKTVFIYYKIFNFRKMPLKEHVTGKRLGKGVAWVNGRRRCLGTAVDGVSAR
jgi:hypothetical protein